MAELQRENFECEAPSARTAICFTLDKTQKFTECCVTHEKVTRQDKGRCILLIQRGLSKIGCREVISSEALFFAERGILREAVGMPEK